MVFFIDAIEGTLATSPLVSVAIIFFVAIILLTISASYLVGALAKIANAVGVSGFIIGTLILAIGNTLPEFTNTLLSNFMNLADLGIGDIIGASIANICLVIGIVAIIQPIKIEDYKVEQVTFFVALAAVILFTFLGMDGILTRFEGAILFFGFIAFQIYSYKQGVTVSRKKTSFKKVAILYFISILSVFILVIASYLVVETSEVMSHTLNISPAILGLTIVALGTTLPELSASIAACIKKEAGMAVGGFVGATILNLLFAAGLVAMIRPIAFHFVLFKIPLVFLFASVAILIAYTHFKKQADRKLGVILISMYAAYISYYIWYIINVI